MRGFPTDISSRETGTLTFHRRPREWVSSHMDNANSPVGLDLGLPAELASAVTARRLLADAMGAWGLPELVRHDAALTASELVTNAVLHARTPLRVRAFRLGAGLRIEVGDGNPHLPVVDAARPEDLLSNRSMTGRGLALISAMSDRWGAEPCEGGGKVIWAEIGTGRRLVTSAPAPAYPPAPPPLRVPAAARAAGVVTGASVTAGGRRIQFVGVPVALILESVRQLSDLQREMQVMVLGGTTPPELEQVVQAGRPWVTDIDVWADADRRAAERAAARGQETIDFELVVPPDVDRRIDGISRWLRRTTTAVTRRYLLTLPASRDVNALRQWYRREILSQMAGADPEPCPLRVGADA